MADEAEKPAIPILKPVAGEYPGPEFPAIYADSVSSIQPGANPTKFYLSRYEPHMRAQSAHLTQPFAQIIMPTPSFVDTAAFFMHTVQRLIDQKVIDQATWDQVVANYNALGSKK
jgi:hypothetical protein